MAVGTATIEEGGLGEMVKLHELGFAGGWRPILAAFLMVLMAFIWGAEEQLQGETPDYYPATYDAGIDS